MVASTDGDLGPELLPRAARQDPGDTAWFSPVVDTSDEGFTWRRRRLAVRGEFFNRVEFEVEREFGDDLEPWRDVWVNVQVHDLLEVRGGKFKLPFGLDNSTSSVEHDFIFRSLGTRALAPGRDIGGMVYGAADRRRFTYAVGVFQGDNERRPDETRFFDDDQGADSFGRTVSGRVTVQPFDTLEALPRGLRNLELGRQRRLVHGGRRPQQLQGQLGVRLRLLRARLGERRPGPHGV